MKKKTTNGVITKEQEKWLLKSQEIFGKDYVAYLAVEEMAELQKEVMHKVNRKRTDLEGIIDEVADLHIMLAHLELMFNVSAEVKERILFKIGRMTDRIKERMKHATQEEYNAAVLKKKELMRKGADQTNQK